MKQLLTDGIILSRTDYGEADRILTMLTPEQGKLRLMARGVRRIKSKLAGGIELFSTSHITYIQGRGELGTLISTRLITHYGNIIKDINRVQLGYDLIKKLNKVTEDHPEAGYYELLDASFASLNNPVISMDLIRTWFEAHLLRLSGRSPNLKTDTAGEQLVSDSVYSFDFDTMAFAPRDSGKYSAADIKVFRLLFSDHTPQDLARIQDITASLDNVSPLIRNMAQSL